MPAEPVEPDPMASELAEALAARGLVLVSAEYLEELEDAADSAIIEARADEETVPFRPEDRDGSAVGPSASGHAAVAEAGQARGNVGGRS